jgi:outer membrane protein assembly factor BamB
MLVAQVAAAQMMGGGRGHHGSSPSSGSNPSGGMMGGMGRGGMMNGMGGGMGQMLTVGPDGVAYTLRVSAATTEEDPSFDVVAIRPAGTIAWTTTIKGVATLLELSGNVVLVATGSGGMGMSRGTDTAEAGSFRLTALDAATGSSRWQLDLDGLAAAIEPFPGGVYAVIVRQDGTGVGDGMHDGSNGTILMKRSVAAIDDAGELLWSINLN